MTTDWPSNHPAAAPTDDDWGATAAVPRYSPTPPPPTSPAPPQYGYGQPAAPGWSPQPAPLPAPGGAWPPHQPPGQYPTPGYPPANPTPPGKKKPWGLIAGALLVAVIVIGAGVFVFGDKIISGSDTKGDNKADGPTTTSQTASPSQQPPAGSATPSPAKTPGAAGSVDPAALPGLLESIPSLNDKYKANLIPAADLATEPFHGLTISPSTCAGALLPGIDYVYRSANYTGFSGQILTDDVTRTKVMQAVIAFSTATEASSFYDTRLSSWKGCNDTTVEAEGGGTKATIKTGSVSDAEGIATLSMWRADKPAGSDGALGCERAMTPVNNVIVDVRVCVKDDAKTLAVNLAKSIGQQITGAP